MALAKLTRICLELHGSLQPQACQKSRSCAPSGPFALPWRSCIQDQETCTFNKRAKNC